VSDAPGAFGLSALTLVRRWAAMIPERVVIVPVPVPPAPVSSLVREIVTLTAQELGRVAQAGAQRNAAAVAVRADATRDRSRTGSRSAFEALSRRPPTCRTGPRTAGDRRARQRTGRPVRRIRAVLTGTAAPCALVGAGDLALHWLRQPAVAARGELAPKLLRDRITTARRAVTAQPGRAHALARARRGAAGRTYGQLARRGRDLVGRVRGGQRPVEQVLERAEQAIRRDRAARSQRTGRSTDRTVPARTKTGRGHREPSRPPVNTE
jgi:hypothetical protein